LRSERVLDKIREYLLDHVAVDHNRTSLGPDEDLLDQGIIDSLGMLRLIGFLEQTFGIEVLDEDVIPENFRTLVAVAGLVARKQAGRPGP
jgi:acyl carrier protein